MANEIGAPLRVRPYRTKTTSRGTPYTSAEALVHLRQNAALCRRVMGNSANLAFSDYSLAPRSFLFAGDLFQFGDLVSWQGGSSPPVLAEFAIPWVVAHGYDLVCARVVLASSFVQPLVLRLESSTLVDAVASTVGRESVASTPHSSSAAIRAGYPAPGDTSGIVHTTVDLYLKPTLPASREVQLKLFCTTQQSASEVNVHEGAFYAHVVHVQSISVFDCPDEESIG